MGTLQITLLCSRAGSIRAECVTLSLRVHCSKVMVVIQRSHVWWVIMVSTKFDDVASRELPLALSSPGNGIGLQD